VRSKSIRRVLLPLALVIGMMSVGVSGAQALTEHPYAGFAIPPGYTVGANAGGTNITGNIAVYYGAGYISVCQRTYDLGPNVYREGCGTNAVGSATNLMPYYGHNLYPHVKNNSPWTHTIHGRFYRG
jgi:hypothetical protein